MASFRPLGQFNQYFLNNGQVNNGGSITFYETDLTTLKNTYSDPALTVLNANPVLLDAAGRLTTDVWGSGIYGAVLKDALGTTIQTRNNIQSGADPGFTIPSLITGDFLTNDGSNLLWEAIRQVPDPTGQNGKVLSTDGTVTFWQTLAALGLPSISTTATGMVIGPIRFQWGSGTLPSTGTNVSNLIVAFPVAFSNPPYFVGVTQTVGSGITSKGDMAIIGADGQSTTGFRCICDINASSGDPPITRATPFQWIAVGPA